MGVGAWPRASISTGEDMRSVRVHSLGGKYRSSLASCGPYSKTDGNHYNVRIMMKRYYCQFQVINGWIRSLLSTKYETLFSNLSDLPCEQRLVFGLSLAPSRRRLSNSNFHQPNSCPRHILAFEAPSSAAFPAPSAASATTLNIDLAVPIRVSRCNNLALLPPFPPVPSAPQSHISLPAPLHWS